MTTDVEANPLLITPDDLKRAEQRITSAVRYPVPGDGELETFARRATVSIRLNGWERQHIITVALCDRLQTAVEGFRERVDHGAAGGGELATECVTVLGGLVRTLTAELDAFDQMSLEEGDRVP